MAPDETFRGRSISREHTGSRGDTVLIINHSRATVARACEVLAEVERRNRRGSAETSAGE